METSPQKQSVKRNSMTEGSVYKALVAFTIPTLLTNILNQLYNMADSIIVGQFAGADALAAVGANTFITMLMVTLFIGAGVGGGVYIAQLYGARKYDDVSKAFNCMYCMIAALAAITGVLAICLAEPLMRLMDTPDNIFDDAVTYFRIYSAALPALAVYSSGSAALRSIGDAKAPLYLLIFSAIMNVVLNLLFVVVFDMAVAGVAWATLIAQYLSAILVLVRTESTKFCKITINLKTLRIDWHMAGIIMKLGIPSALQTGVQSFGNVLCQRYINFFGSNAIAAASTVMRLDGFIMMPAQAIGQSVSIFFGQNLAAKKEDRLHKGTLFGVSLAVIISVALSVVLYIFAEWGLRLFTSEAEVIELGASMLRVLCYFYWTMALFNVFGGIMRGAGDTLTVMLISLIGMVIRVPLSWFMAVRPEPPVFANLFWAMSICNIVMCVLAVAYYFTGRWKKKVVVTIDD